MRGGGRCDAKQAVSILLEPRPYALPPASTLEHLAVHNSRIPEVTREKAASVRCGCTLHVSGCVHGELGTAPVAGAGAFAQRRGAAAAAAPG